MEVRTIELPTQMPIVSSVLFFSAIHTLVTCSAALATIGMRMRPMKGFGCKRASATIKPRIVATHDMPFLGRLLDRGNH